MNFEETVLFKKDLKRLGKKYRSLSADLAVFKSNIPFVDLADNSKFIVLHNTENRDIIKARCFCRYLRGSSLRIVFARSTTGDKIVFLELFFKSGKTREDKERIKDYLLN